MMARAVTIPIRQTLRPDAVAGWRRRCASAGSISSYCRATGPAAVAPVANELGIANWQAALKPAEKIAKIEELKAQGHRVLMVGDGLNDAPALAAAHVSISPITAAHLTQAHADALSSAIKLRPVLQGGCRSRSALAA